MKISHDIKSTFVIDWLSVTHRRNANEERISEAESLAYANATAVLAGLRSHRSKPHSSYKNAIMYENGALVQWNPSRPEMGTNYLYTGSVLKTYDAFALLRDHVRGGGRVRRLDLSIDTNAPLDIWRLKTESDRGRMVSRSRTEPRYIKEKGETLYIGARTSEEFVRIYDKRAEQNLPESEPAWYRLEMKLTDDKAINAAHAVINEGIGVIARLIRGYVDFPSVTVWGLLFDNVEGVTLSAGERKLSDTKAWLMTQVASALARIVHDDPEFKHEFLGEIVARTAPYKGVEWFEQD